MIMRLTPALLLLSVLLSGCASFNRVHPSPVTAPVGPSNTTDQTAFAADPLAGDHPTTCDRTHRDLTVDWQARRYLCVREGRRTASLKAGGWQLPKHLTRSLLAANTATTFHPLHQNPDSQAIVLNPLTLVEPAPLQDPFTVSSVAGDPGVLEVPTGAESGSWVLEGPTVPDTGAEVLEGPTGSWARRGGDFTNLTRQTGSRVLEGPTKAESAAKAVGGDVQSTRIRFAPAQEQLGEKGLARSLALLPAIQAAQRVTLLGVFEDDELAGEPAPLERERFSVARALSVRDLWIAQGVDPAKLTILHHQDRLAGRYVEVMLHD